VSYDDTSLAELDRARSALGDTATTELLSDDHIEMIIAEDGYNLGVAMLADELAVRFAQKPGSVRLPSGLSVSWADRVATWRAVAERYRALAAAEVSATTLPLTSRAATVAVW
jgi:hypothetical protein